MSDLGKQGSMEPAKYKDAMEEGKPKTGFDSAPKGEKMNFEATKGFGGTNPGAH